LIGGDEGYLILNLKGPGVVSMGRSLYLNFVRGKPTAIGPGKKIVLPITSLNYGCRGIASVTYWTKPGDYTLTATYKTPVVKVASAPIKLKVVEKE
jgi:hypothetical protein